MLTDSLPSLNQETQDLQSLLEKAQEYFRIRETKATPAASLIDAWGDFFLIENARLYRFVAMTKSQQSEIDDVVQEVWMEIVQKLTGFQGEGAIQQLHCWMYKLTRSKSALLIRRRISHPTKALNEVAWEPEDGCEKAEAEKEFNGRIWELFHQWLNSLAEKESQNHALMFERFVEERGVQEIAQATAMSPNVVSGRLKRLKERFRIWLSRRDETDALPW